MRVEPGEASALEAIISRHFGAIQVGAKPHIELYRDFLIPYVK
jgi:hypothetical protein